jgi:hypothetical protein
MKISTLFIALILSGWSLAIDTLDSHINKATVFLSGAQVFRLSKTFNVKKGVNELIIADVSSFLNQQHIQSTVLGNGFVILDV